MEEKLTQIKIFCDDSQYIRQTAERLGLKYFDVSFERDRVLGDVLEYVRREMG